MGSLSSSLNIAVGAMQADQAAITTTTNNIANANTPGYTRQTVSFAETPPVEYGHMMFGTGVEVGQITSQRDNILQLRLDQETQQQSKYNSYLNTMQQVQTPFNETSGSGLQSSISAFFNSLQQLSTSPTDANLRQAVLTSAQNMAQAFNSASSNLTSVQQNVDLSVTQSVNQINSLTSQIAQLNAEVNTAQGTGRNAGTFVDQRDQLIQQLSGVLDVSVTDAGNGNLTITTSSGASLVIGNQNYQLTTQADPTTGFQRVYALGTDITSKITAGALGGALQVRDTAIPSIVSSLDALASNLESSFNSVNQAGYDLNGAQGGNFFIPPPGSGVGAAAAMTLAINDPTKIAGSLDGTAGDNANINAMIALQNQPIVNGQTPLNAYASLVFQVGNDVSSAQSEAQGAQAVVQQLQNQIGAVSGVSLNEEAANLVQFQRAYQAAAQVAGIINTLTATAINLGSTTTVS